MNGLKVSLEIPNNVIEDILIRSLDEKSPNYIPDEIVRDEIDKLMDNKEFLNDFIQQVKGLAEYRRYKEYFIQMMLASKLGKPKNGRGKHVHHGRHKKGIKL